ncbi:MAG: hypothetical protein ABL995_00155 [Bryobacteraceae bacterium]
MATPAPQFPEELLSRAERFVFRKLKTPALIQRFLDEELGYNKEPGGATCYSPRMVLKEGVAHCMEGALLAAMALRRLGHPPLLVDLEAVRDSDHVLAVYRVKGHWGSVAKSDYTGLRSREPVYATIRELAISYFEDYYNMRGEKSLRAYSRPVNLARFDKKLQWMTTFEELWPIPEHFCVIPHSQILKPGHERHLSKTDAKLFQAGRVGGVAAPLLDLSRIPKPKKPARKA